MATISGEQYIREIMAYPDAWLYQITSEGLERIEYRQTEHYIVAKRFLNDPKGQLDQLLS